MKHSVRAQNTCSAVERIRISMYQRTTLTRLHRYFGQSSAHAERRWILINERFTFGFRLEEVLLEGDQGCKPMYARRQTEAAAQCLGSQIPRLPAVVSFPSCPSHGYWRHAPTTGTRSSDCLSAMPSAAEFCKAPVRRLFGAVL